MDSPGRRFAWCALALVASCGVALVLQLFGSGDSTGSSTPGRPVESPAPPEESGSGSESERDPTPAPPEVRATPSREDLAANVRLTPELPDTVRGRVLDPAGKPVGGARVALASYDLGAMRARSSGLLRIDLEAPAAAAASPASLASPTRPAGRDLPIAFAATAETNDAGRFEFAGVAAKDPEIFARHRDRLTVSKNGYGESIVYPLQRRSVEIRLVPLFVLTGTVRVDATDAPISNSVLVIGDLDDRTAIAITRTDDIGRFQTSEPLARGTYRATSYREGCGPLAREFESRDGYVEIEMPSYPDCVVQVRDAVTEKPLAAATVRDGVTALRGETRFDDRIGNTDAGGTLRIRELEPLRSLVVECEGYCSALVDAPTSKAQLDAAMELNVALLPVAQIVGRFVDSSGRPLSKLRVSSRRASSVPLAIALDKRKRAMLRSDGRSEFRGRDPFVETDADGRFALSVWPVVVPIECTVLDPQRRVEGKNVATMARGSPGKKIDLGDITLRPLRAEAEAGAAAPASSISAPTWPFSVTLTSLTGERLPDRCIELLTVPPASSRDVAGDSASLVGFGFTDRTGSLRVEVVSAFAPGLEALHCDGFRVAVVGQLDDGRAKARDAWDRQDVVAQPCFVGVRLTDEVGAPPAAAVELRFREEGRDSDFLPYLWSPVVQFDAGGRAMIALPAGDPRFASLGSGRVAIEARLADGSGSFRALGVVVPAIESELDARGRWNR